MFKGALKPYQVDAVQKMTFQKKILVAYEMGLGKTPMTIAAIEQIRERGELKGDFVLILCLASLKYQWKKEIEKFSDSTALVIDGTPKKRKEQYAEAPKYDYIIINYEQVLSDWETVRSMFPSAMVCDEATAIKSFRAKRAKKVKDLSKNTDIRFALTGTPIENGKPEEVYSIMQFVNPQVLGRFDLFDQAFIVRNHFGGVMRYRNLPTLQKILADHSVRKSQKDDDVAPFLPSQIERQPVVLQLDAVSQNIYDEITTDLYFALQEAFELFGSSFNLALHYGQSSENEDAASLKIRGEIMGRIQALRMLCSHPPLFQHSAREYEKQGKHGSGYIYSHFNDRVHTLTKSPKMDAVVKYLKDFLDTNSAYKAVVFSSFLLPATELSTRLLAAGYDNRLYTGQLDAKQKETAKTAFQDTDEVRVLISSDAGGYGVDLPQGNLLINYDQPWSNGMMVQRNGRIIRTSSQWQAITLQDFIVDGSIEQRQWNMLRQKSAVASAVIDGKGINAKGGVDLTVGSLMKFLEEGFTND